MCREIIIVLELMVVETRFAGKQVPATVIPNRRRLQLAVPLLMVLGALVSLIVFNRDLF
jgi:hypothetical protein